MYYDSDQIDHIPFTIPYLSIRSFIAFFFLSFSDSATHSWNSTWAAPISASKSSSIKLSEFNCPLPIFESPLNNNYLLNYIN